VLSNGFHSDIALPASNGESLAALGVAASDFHVNTASVRYWAFGWGSKTAYTSLLAVSDLTAGIVAEALAFDETVMHIQPLGQISPAEGVYAFELTPEAYRRLVDAIGGSFGEAKGVIAGITQGYGDRFYVGSGRFSPWRSCNTWTGQMLREAGIGVGLWTPFAPSLEFGLERTAHQLPGTR
jgi:uncharacterized protein (TIGR02117 family)